MLIPLISLECSSPVIVLNRAENVRLITEIYKKIIVTLFEQGNSIHLPNYCSILRYIPTYSHIHPSFICNSHLTLFGFSHRV